MPVVFFSFVFFLSCNLAHTDRYPKKKKKEEKKKKRKGEEYKIPHEREEKMTRKDTPVETLRSRGYIVPNLSDRSPAVRTSANI